MSLLFPEPPTKEHLANARKAMETTRTSAQELTTKINAAEQLLTDLVRESRCAINEMEKNRARLEKEMMVMMAYLSPIRRLPLELLREIFMWNFEDYSCCAWILAAVCGTWRKLALRMPKIWSTIRLYTSQNSSADTIRLWLERSGDTIPLDIEIYLRVAGQKQVDSSSGSRRLSLPNTPPIPPYQHGIGGHYIIPHIPHPQPVTLAVLPPAHTPIIIAPSSPANSDWLSSPHPSSERSSPKFRFSMHWGHIAIFYLVEQMHRWERFVFRFDKQFASMGALKSITGDAPLLKEFEVSSAETAFFTEWPWLPNAGESNCDLPHLKVLTLQYIPFKWSSPMLHSNLHTLNLRALPTVHLPLDRILYILSNNQALVNLSLHFQGVMAAILPLTPTSLPHLESLNLGGHYILTQLVDCLNLPNLNTLVLDLEARDPIEDLISNLLTRSAKPPLEHLSVAYGSAGNSSSYYYGPGGIVISWNNLLNELSNLKSLHIGGTPIEPLLNSLGPPDDDINQLTVWQCPTLEVLGMRHCHAHSEGVAKLVQMVDARNPDIHGSTGGTAVFVNGVSPVRLKMLELHECASLGQDVIKWLTGRVDEVVCTEPTYERRY